MLDLFLKASYEKTKQASADKCEVELLSRLPDETLCKIAMGFEKLAWGDLASPPGEGSWLDKFRDTPLFAEALEIEKQDLQQQMAQKQQSDANRQMYDQQDSSRSELSIQRKLLELKAAEGTMAEGAGEIDATGMPNQAPPDMVGTAEGQPKQEDNKSMASVGSAVEPAQGVAAKVASMRMKLALAAHEMVGSPEQRAIESGMLKSYGKGNYRRVTGEGGRVLGYTGMSASRKGPLGDIKTASARLRMKLAGEADMLIKKMVQGAGAAKSAPAAGKVLRTAKSVPPPITVPRAAGAAVPPPVPRATAVQQATHVPAAEPMRVSERATLPGPAMPGTLRGDVANPVMPHAAPLPAAPHHATAPGALTPAAAPTGSFIQRNKVPLALAGGVAGGMMLSKSSSVKLASVKTKTAIGIIGAAKGLYNAGKVGAFGTLAAQKAAKAGGAAAGGGFGGAAKNVGRYFGGLAKTSPGMAAGMVAAPALATGYMMGRD